MKRVLFFDIDGTLLDYNGQMPASAIKGLKQARLNGNIAVICTGRSSYQLLPYKDMINEYFDGVIGSTGSLVMYNNKLIYEHYVDDKAAANLWQSFETNGEVIVCQAEERAVLSQTSYDFMMKRLRDLGRSEERIKILMGDALIVDKPTQIHNIKKFFYHNCKRSIEQLRDIFSDTFDIESSSFQVEEEGSGEITAKGINKSYGMKMLLDYLDIPVSDVFAFGDSANDIDMLKFAGTGVAMGNARQSVKDIADYVTTDVDKDGIYNALQYLDII